MINQQYYLILNENAYKSYCRIDTLNMDSIFSLTMTGVWYLNLCMFCATEIQTVYLP